MAESDYVNLIAQGLKAYHDAGYMAEFDANVGKVYGNTFDYEQFYSIMGWYGLDNTKQFNTNSLNTSWKNDYDNYIKAPGICKDSKKCN